MEDKLAVGWIKKIQEDPDFIAGRLTCLLQVAQRTEFRWPRQGRCRSGESVGSVPVAGHWQDLGGQAANRSRYDWMLNTSHDIF